MIFFLPLFVCAIFQLAVQGIIFSVTAMTFFVPYGVSVAASIKVGNFLGDGNSQHARLSAESALMVACCTQVTENGGSRSNQINSKKIKNSRFAVPDCECGYSYFPAQLYSTAFLA
jgi:hypothetical protein